MGADYDGKIATIEKIIKDVQFGQMKCMSRL